MSKDIREHLESIAMDMVLLSMKHKRDSRARAWDEVRGLTDEELIDFIVK